MLQILYGLTQFRFNFLDLLASVLYFVQALHRLRCLCHTFTFYDKSIY
jgi:hypothetical protein